MILEKIDQLLKEVSNLQASNAEEIEQLRLKYLSKKGEITALMADFRNVAADQKTAVGIRSRLMTSTLPAQLTQYSLAHAIRSLS